ncbi:MAG: TPM domain-containing protein [Myxococcota bacterium]
MIVPRHITAYRSRNGNLAGAFYIALALLFWLPATAVAALAIPSLTGPVIDEAGLLPATTRQQLSSALHTFHSQTGHQLQVLIIPSLQGEVIEDYSIRVVEKWQLGSAEKDDGVLLLIAVQDRKWRIEVGGGLEGDLTDAQATRIGQDILTPAFRQKAYAQGIASTLAAIAESLGGTLELSGTGIQPTEPPPKSRSIGSLIMMLIFLMFFLGGRRGGGSMLPAMVLGGMLGGSHRGSGFGGGSSRGGWSGGGGGFSGGGSSGSW